MNAMARVSIATMDKAVAVPSSDGSPGVARCDLLTGASHPIHLRVHELSPGAGMQVSAQDTDVALFVWRGSVSAGGAELGAMASAVVEHGASLQVVAGQDGASVAAFTMNAQRPARDGGHVHLLPSERVPRTAALGGNEGIGGALHADAQCPTCSVWLHENSYAMADKETTVHSHSEDEVIFVHTGSIRLGRRIYGPGTALAVAADTKYGFHSGPDGLGFVNFRGSSPTYTSGDGKTVMDEAKLWRDLLGAPQYLEVQS
jgi:hypothetical protein